MSDAFILGYEAADCGYAIEDNIYTPETANWYAWIAGYKSCCRAVDRYGVDWSFAS